MGRGVAVGARSVLRPGVVLYDEVRIGEDCLLHAGCVVAAASVLGDRVGARPLERATDLEADAVAAALDELEWQRWLSAEPRGYSFVARVVRDVVARDMLTPGQRQRILDAADS